MDLGRHTGTSVFSSLDFLEVLPGNTMPASDICLFFCDQSLGTCESEVKLSLKVKEITGSDNTADNINRRYGSQ